MWPKEVPILTEKDICKHRFDGPKNTHCLLGWCSIVFSQVHTSKMKEVTDYLIDEIDVISRHKYDDVVKYNDLKHTKKKTLAKVWNRAMASLGYVVGNPEAKSVK